MDFSHILSLLGGVAFFLYGMNSMGTGLKKVAGPKMENTLWRLSSTPVKGFFLGVLVAAVIQSSSATSVMVVSFVNAGMMRLAQAICIVLGSNVGTTMTGWILTLSSGAGGGSLVSDIFSTATLVSVLVLIGIIMLLFSKKSTVKNIGSIFLGLGTLLLSMTLISDAVSPLKESESFREILLLFENPVLGILAGALVAAVVQSSSAGVGILQALSVSGALSYSACLPLILGINIGAATPVLLSMIGGNRNGKRTSLTYLLSNVLGAIIIYLLYLPAQAIFSFDFFSESAGMLGIAVMNSTIRIVVALILLPCHGLLEKVVCRLVPVLPEESADTEEIDCLTESLLRYVPAAIEKAADATRKMAEIVQQNLLRSVALLDRFDPEEFRTVQEKESIADKYEDKIGNFILNLEKAELTSSQQAQVARLLSAIGDFERMSDHAVNLSEVAQEKYEKKIHFSEEAQGEIELLLRAVREILSLAIDGFLSEDALRAEKVEPLEEVIDQMCKFMRANHILRLQNADCTILTGFVFNDLLTNLERVADHSSNVAFSVLHSGDLSTEEHAYAEAVALSDAFRNQFDSYSKIYLLPFDHPQISDHPQTV